ncbi:MAG TPA: histidine kinase, partial [Nannocystis exedens]|nr:histidine kinase [Nannocystis exedens]
MSHIGSDDVAASLAALERSLTGEANEEANLADRLMLLSRAAALFQERLSSSEQRLHQVTGRLEEMLEVVTSLTALEYDRKVPLSDDDDWIVNALAIGLNIMGDELAQATRELTTARDGALAASRAKSTFLANMSHELRTPLNAIIGYSELIREELEAGECCTISTDLGHVESSAHHLLDLIQDTLDLSKIEAGKMEMTIESFDLGALLRTIAGAVEPMMRDRNNHLTLTIPDDLGICTTDRTKCRQIFYNLLSNASKFTNGGPITLRARSDNRDQNLLIEVEDSGIGIPAAKLPEIFGAFTQADNSTSRDYGGTGLGLTISR